MNVKPLQFMFQLTQGHRRKLLFSCLCAALGTLLQFIPYIAVFKLTDEVLSKTGNISHIQYLIVVAGVAVVLRFIMMGISTTLAHFSAFHILYDLRSKLINKLALLPLGYFSSNTSGQLEKVVVDDVERVESFVAHHLPDLTSSIVAPIISGVYLFYIDWRLGIASILPIPAAYLIQLIISIRGSRGEEMKQIHNLSESMSAAIVEFVHAMPVIKAYNQTVHSFSRYHDSVERYAQLWGKIAKKKVPLHTLFMLLLESGLIFVLPLSAWLYMQGEISAAVVVLFLLMGVSLTAPLREISTLAHMMQNNMEGVRRIQKILHETELQDRSEHIQPIPTQYDIEFSQVTFSYPEDNREILSNVNFVAPHGKLTAFVGPSGAGKSTAAQLISRFFEPTTGHIKIGGINVTDIPQQDLMSMISFVFQDVPVLSDTVSANLRMERTMISDEEMIIAAKAAQAHEFIMALPNGYETVIGELGVSLSGGERQRIAIARAILKQAPILIMDEAFAFSDAENESRIHVALGALFANKTVIIIAHRLSTITDVDQIIVMDKGSVVASGTHEELISTSVLYRKLWQAHREAGNWLFPVKEGPQDV